MSKKTKKMFEEKLKDKLKKEGINEDWMKKHLVILSEDEEISMKYKAGMKVRLEDQVFELLMNVITARKVGKLCNEIVVLQYSKSVKNATA